MEVNVTVGGVRTCVAVVRWIFHVDGDVTKMTVGHGGGRKTCGCDKRLSGKNPSQPQMSRAGVMVREQN